MQFKHLWIALSIQYFLSGMVLMLIGQSLKAQAENGAVVDSGNSDSGYVAIAKQLARPDPQSSSLWYAAKTLGIEGRGWSGDHSKDDFDFGRLPPKAESIVRKEVWNLSRNSSGLSIRFRSNASELKVRWTLTSGRLAMPHMAATGVSGLDLYVETASGWRWLATGKPSEQSNEQTLFQDLPTDPRDYILYLPLYNGVSDLDLGIPEDTTMWVRTGDEASQQERLPIVIWGTSITQGASASRPGNAYTSILSRNLNWPVINLGFSGNGKLEPEMARLISELDAAAFVIDCIPNVNAEEIDERLYAAIEALRDAHPDTPILLVEDRAYSDSFLIKSRSDRNRQNHEALKRAIQRCEESKIQGLHVIESHRLLSPSGDDTVDGSHPTDAGFQRYAEAVEQALRPILKPASESWKWYKGNLHTHTLWSDGDDFPEMVADWYQSRDYHFLALSDHNVLSVGERWMKLTEIEKRAGSKGLQRYVDRFGSEWVETRGEREAGTMEVRLKPLEEVKPLVERSGQFLMIPSEEITDKGVHINATNIAEVIPPQKGSTIRETIENNLKAVDEQAKRLGRKIIPHLNHPNLGDKGISAEELAALVQDEFFEVYNGVEEDGDLGSPRRHSLETLWDITSTLRLSEFLAPPLYGLSTDDSHNYHGKNKAMPGRGWIMVKAERLTPEALISAIKKGRFYASTGVVLKRADFDSEQRTLSIEVDPRLGVNYTIEFMGTRRGFDKQVRPRIDPETGAAIENIQDYSSDVGMIFARVEGHRAIYRLNGDELYVRAVVTSDAVPPYPTSESMVEKAWTQPVGWRIP